MYAGLGAATGQSAGVQSAAAAAATVVGEGEDQALPLRQFLQGIPELRAHVPVQTHHRLVLGVMPLRGPLLLHGVRGEQPINDFARGIGLRRVADCLRRPVGRAAEIGQDVSEPLLPVDARRVRVVRANLDLIELAVDHVPHQLEPVVHGLDLRALPIISEHRLGGEDPRKDPAPKVHRDILAAVWQRIIYVAGDGGGKGARSQPPRPGAAHRFDFVPTDAVAHKVAL